MKPYPVDRLTAVLLILAGAAAPGAVVTYHLGSLGLLGALAFVLTLIYAVDKRLPDAGASMPDDAIETPHAATGPTERLDQRFPEVYARDVADGQDTRHSSVWLIRRYSSYSVAHQEAVKRPYNEICVKGFTTKRTHNSGMKPFEAIGRFK